MLENYLNKFFSSFVLFNILTTFSFTLVYFPEECLSSYVTVRYDVIFTDRSLVTEGILFNLRRLEKKKSV